VDKCVKKAKTGQLMIRLAVEKFEEESLEAHAHDANLGERYAKTLEQLTEFKEMGDPFDRDCFKPFADVYDYQVSYLKVLSKMREKLGKKKDNAKSIRILSNVVFATAFASVLVLTVVATASGAPLVVAAVGSALAPPIGYVGKWLSKVNKEYEKAAKRQKGLVLSLERSTDINIKAMETIRIQVVTLRTMIESIQKKADLAQEEASRLVMQEIKNSVDEFTEKIKAVGENTNRCMTCIANGRVLVLQYITTSLN